LRKVHGGAVPRPEAPRVYSGRAAFASERKAALARKALPLVGEGQLILMDGGTSNWHLASILPPELRATVFTNSIPIVNSLMGHPGISLHLLGGRVFKDSQVTVGIEMVEALQQIRPDICFIGLRSIHPQLGLTTLEPDEARLKRHMLQVSSRKVVLVTADKLDTVDHYKICNTGEIDLMVVEDGVEAEKLEPYREQGLELW
jgi:DeoR/GlpR family transcriptional regulator of sugar metabolism